MKQPKLNQYFLTGAFPERGVAYFTMSPGQWDNILKGAYESGATLLEIRIVNGREKIARAFRKPESRN